MSISLGEYSCEWNLLDSPVEEPCAQHKGDVGKAGADCVKVDWSLMSG